MENPETWGEAERIVGQVFADDHANSLKPPEEMLIGLSLNRRITDALRQAGLLVDPDELARLRLIETKARGLVHTSGFTRYSDMSDGEVSVVPQWWAGLKAALG